MSNVNHKVVTTATMLLFVVCCFISKLSTSRAQAAGAPAQSKASGAKAKPQGPEYLGDPIFYVRSTLRPRPKNADEAAQILLESVGGREMTEPFHQAFLADWEALTNEQRENLSKWLQHEVVDSYEAVTSYLIKTPHRRSSQILLTYWDTFLDEREKQGYKLPEWHTQRKWREVMWKDVDRSTWIQGAELACRARLAEIGAEEKEIRKKQAPSFVR